MQLLAILIFLVLLPIPALGSGSTTPDRDLPSRFDPVELVPHWNALLLEVAELEDNFLTLKGVRAAAMMHLAMHDALNAVEPRFERFADFKTISGAEAMLAANEAAFEVSVNQYPEQRQRLERARDSWLVLASASESLPASRSLGRRAAAAILATREEDGWNRDAEYTWHPMGPGVYAEFEEHSGTPNGFVFGAGWARARTFVLNSHDQFRSPPPPDVAGPDYAAAFDEVKEVGSKVSAVRTEDQTHLAFWWKDFVESSHNRLARDLAREDRLDPWVAARFFARLNMSVYDAYVNVFDNKFHYNHWRPYTAIRWAANDGNPSTSPDPNWTNAHDHTYAFPSYPSAHGCACAAAMEVMADTFGEARPFTMRTERVDEAGPLSGKIAMKPPTRSFGSFSDAAEECALSRIYLGIHFRYDSVEGNRLGQRVGSHVLQHALGEQQD